MRSRVERTMSKTPDSTTDPMKSDGELDGSAYLPA